MTTWHVLLPSIRKTIRGVATNANPARMLIPKSGFGIAAAVTADGIIGMDGKLPWTRSAPSSKADRSAFVRLTRGKILIVGRKTFFDEDPTGGHVAHVGACVVVSRTMERTKTMKATTTPMEEAEDRTTPRVEVVRSFDEALVVAQGMHEERRNSADDDDDDDDDVFCWVGGGETLYGEALLHPLAKVLRLTTISDVDGGSAGSSSSLLSSNENDNDHQRRGDYRVVARFPNELAWMDEYELVSSDVDGACDFRIYRRMPRRSGPSDDG